MKHMLITIGLMCACSAAPTDAPAKFNPDVVGTVFTPTPEAEYDLSIALYRLELATGLAFTAGPNGVPVSIVDQAWYGDTVPACATTNIIAHRVIATGEEHVSGVYIQITDPLNGDCWPDASRSMEHEIIHALRRKVSATTNLDGTIDVNGLLNDHTKTGLFQLHSNADNKMDTASLTKVCEAVPCTVFNTED